MKEIFDDQLIVVTGGAGFIGSCVIRHLNDKGLSNIVVVDELRSSEKWKNLVGKKFVDILAKDQLFSWLQGREDQIEAFIHLGACSDTMEVDAHYLLENNYRYTVRLADYALEHGHRFIYASSAATYGDGSQGFVDDESQIFNLQPLNMYGFSKQLFDQWALQNGVQDKLVGLKYFNVFGPNEYHKGRMASAITKFVPQIQKGENVRLFKSSEPSKYGDGEQKRDFIYVKDAVRMTCDFLENEECGLFNIGSDRASTWNELATAVYNAMDEKPRIEYVDMPKDLINKYQNYSRADMTKTMKALRGNTQCMSLEAAVSDYVRNYLIPGKTW
jgi:ADP-L-glycero-D-manno-heptose 6-epimerase